MDRRHAMLRRQVWKKFDLNRWAEWLDPVAEPQTAYQLERTAADRNA